MDEKRILVTNMKRTSGNKFTCAPTCGDISRRSSSRTRLYPCQPQRMERETFQKLQSNLKHGDRFV